MTSSPAAGLLVVPFVTVPVRVWAADEARAREKINTGIKSRRAKFASLVKELLGTTDLFARPLKRYEIKAS